MTDGSEQDRHERTGADGVDDDPAAGDPASGDPASGVVTVTRPGHRARALGAIAIVIVVAIAFLGWRDRRQLEDEITRLQTKLDEARGDAGEQITDLEIRVEDLEAELATAYDEVESVGSRLETVSGQLTATESTLAERTAELDTERALTEELRAELDAIGAVTAPMPELLGATIEDAEAFAAELDAILLVDRTAPPNVLARPGTIIGQQPDMGVVIVPGALIRIELYEPGD